MIGSNIVNVREAAGLSQTELAEKLGISRHLMYKYEHNIITNVPSDRIEKIASICNVSPARIMGWDCPGKIKSDIDFPDGYSELDDIDKAQVKGFVKALLKDEKYKKSISSEAM